MELTAVHIDLKTFAEISLKTSLFKLFRQMKEKQDPSQKYFVFLYAYRNISPAFLKKELD